MPLEIVTVPCRTDNYAYLVHDPAGGTTAVVDAPEAAPIEAALAERGWRLGTILITHHHEDHVAGVEELRRRHRARVVGAAADRARLPALDRAVSGGEAGEIGGFRAEVIDVPGHTVGHIAYHVPEARALFSADSLMVMGCGRLFEGTAEQMWASLAKLAALPDDTRVYSGHEYTESNLRFAQSVDGDNPALRDRAERIAELRRRGAPTMGPTLAEERATNPFLRAAAPEMKRRLGMEDAADAAVFAELRARKDRF